MRDSNTRRKYKRFLRISTQKCLTFILTLCVGSLFLSIASADTLLTEFGRVKVGTTPSQGWRARGGDAEGIYKVLEEKKVRYLQAKDKGQSVQLFRKVKWPIKKEPILKWRWRAHEFPIGSNELKGPNDSAAAIYVVFPRVWFIPEIIKYVWSVKVPEGTIIRKSGHYSIVVVRSGKKPLNSWVEEKRDVAKDFRKIFGRKAPKPVAIGFLTDANGVKKKSAAADYGELYSVPLTPITAQ